MTPQPNPATKIEKAGKALRALIQKRQEACSKAVIGQPHGLFGTDMIYGRDQEQAKL